MDELGVDEYPLYVENQKSETSVVIREDRSEYMYNISAGWAVYTSGPGDLDISYYATILRTLPTKSSS